MYNNIEICYVGTLKENNIKKILSREIIVSIYTSTLLFVYYSTELPQRGL